MKQQQEYSRTAHLAMGDVMPLLYVHSLQHAMAKQLRASELCHVIKNAHVQMHAWPTIHSKFGTKMAR